jgi:hypothetical protein
MRGIWECGIARLMDQTRVSPEGRGVHSDFPTLGACRPRPILTTSRPSGLQAVNAILRRTLGPHPQDHPPGLWINVQTYELSPVPIAQTRTFQIEPPGDCGTRYPGNEGISSPAKRPAPRNGSAISFTRSGQRRCARGRSASLLGDTKAKMDWESFARNAHAMISGTGLSLSSRLPRM